MLGRRGIVVLGATAMLVGAGLACSSLSNSSFRGFDMQPALAADLDAGLELAGISLIDFGQAPSRDQFEYNTGRGRCAWYTLLGASSLHLERVTGGDLGNVDILYGDFDESGTHPVHAVIASQEPGEDLPFPLTTQELYAIARLGALFQTSRASSIEDCAR